MTKRDSYFWVSWARVLKNQNGEEEKKGLNDGEWEEMGQKYREEEKTKTKKNSEDIHAIKSLFS